MAPGALRLLPCAGRRPATGGAPPSQALLDAFEILRRDRTAEDELPAVALKALRQRTLTPVARDAARLLRSAAGARAWVVPVPDVDRADPLMCKKAGADPREGVAVVAIGGAPAGGGGALRDLMRGLAPVAIEPCAGEKRDMLGVSGMVPDGVSAVFLTAADGTAVRADVTDNGFSFVVPRARVPESRYVVWSGADGTPHVQPVSGFAAPPSFVCTSKFRGLPVQVTPNGSHGCVVFPTVMPPPGALPAFVIAPAPRAKAPSRAAARRRARVRRQVQRVVARQRALQSIARRPAPVPATATCAFAGAPLAVLAPRPIPPRVALVPPRTRTTPVPPRAIPPRAVPAPARPAPLPAPVAPKPKP